MCGIAGTIQLDGRAVDVRLLESMTSALAHRGPDGEGYALLSATESCKPISLAGRLTESIRCAPRVYTVGFGHRRLAILDRSPLGQQPLCTSDGRYWITYNGEIYNYRELRNELLGRGYEFQSMTDTEVVLHAYREWGTACLGRFNGMFAFAIWDGPNERVFCARDRFGIKPFYYAHSPSQFNFASEIKALRADAEALSTANPRMVYDFLVLHLLDHTDETLFDGIRQLRPGQYVLLEGGRLTAHQWWMLPRDLEMSEQAAADPVESFQRIFRDAVRMHLRSDVPVGACLSGGLDSSSIVCVMREVMPDHPINTFCACTNDPSTDERPYLRSVVSHAHLDCVEIDLDGRRLFDEIPRMLWAQDEPFGGTSFLAQWSVMQAVARAGIKVVLDGQGGDELLCGYPGYWGTYWADLLRGGEFNRVCHEARAYYANQGTVHPSIWGAIGRAMMPRRLVAGVRTSLKGQTAWLNNEFTDQHRDRVSGLMFERATSSRLGDHLAAFLGTHSLPALLHHEDRSAMAFSVEARLPFLDKDLSSFLWNLPAAWKLREGQSKVILREALRGVLPETVRARKTKLGFATPQDQWLRETFRPDIEELMASRSFVQRSYWNANRVRDAYRRYCQGERGVGPSLWRCVILELWHRHVLNN